MTSPYLLLDYRSRLFYYKTLAKTLGEPNIDSIAKLYREVKRNAQKVPTTLGGGQNGYLGVVIPQYIQRNIRHMAICETRRPRSMHTYEKKISKYP